MPVVALTDAFVRGLAPPESGRMEVRDSRCRGLSLRVTAAGVKTWTFRYRDRIASKVERRTLGRFPDVGLAKARELADADRASVHLGGGPQAELRKARDSEQTAINFDTLAQRYLDEFVKAQNRASTAAVVKSFLAAPRARWGSKKAKDISRTEIVTFLDERARKAPIGANRTLAALRGLFAWAVERELLDATPIANIKKPTRREIAKDRVLSDAEIQPFWALTGHAAPAIGDALRLILCTGQRPGQVAAMAVSDLVHLDDPKRAAWHIPAAQRKDTRGAKSGAHVVPLSRLAVGIVREAIFRQGRARESSGNAAHVLASRRNPGSAIDRHSLARALKRLLVDEPDSGAVKSLKLSPPTPHDLRRTCATGMSSLGIVREDRMAVLDHSQNDVHAQHYDRFDRLPQKRVAVEAWARKLEGLLSGSPASACVITIGRRRA